MMQSSTIVKSLPRIIKSFPHPNIYPGFQRDVAPRVWLGNSMTILVPKEPAMLLPSLSRGYHTYNSRVGAAKPMFKVQVDYACIAAANSIAKAMVGIRDLPWEELGWWDKINKMFWGSTEQVRLNDSMAGLDMESSVASLKKMIDTKKAVVMIGNNLTMPESEGGSKYITHHAIVVFDYVEDSRGKVKFAIIDPDNTTSHPNMEKLREYARERGKSLSDLSHSEIIEGTNDPSALIRMIDAETLIGNLSKVEGLESPYTFEARPGLAVVESGPSPSTVEGVD